MVVNEWLRSTVFFGLVFVTVANYGNEYLLFEHLYRISRRNVALRDGQRKFFFWIKGTFWYSTETKRRSSSCVCVCLLSLGLFIFLSNSALCVFYGRGGLVCHSFQSSIFRVSFLVSGSTLRSCSATTRRLPNLVPDERSTKNLPQISHKPPPDIYEKKSPFPSLSLSLSRTRRRSVMEDCVTGQLFLVCVWRPWRCRISGKVVCYRISKEENLVGEVWVGGGRDGRRRRKRRRRRWWGQGGWRSSQRGTCSRVGPLCSWNVVDQPSPPGNTTSAWRIGQWKKRNETRMEDVSLDALPSHNGSSHPVFFFNRILSRILMSLTEFVFVFNWILTVLGWHLAWTFRYSCRLLWNVMDQLSPLAEISHDTKNWRAGRSETFIGWRWALLTAFMISPCPWRTSCHHLPARRARRDSAIRWRVGSCFHSVLSVPWMSFIAFVEHYLRFHKLYLVQRCFTWIYRVFTMVYSALPAFTLFDCFFG